MKPSNQMYYYSIDNPHAQMALWLSHKLRGAPPDVVTATLNASGCPRRLFVLASVLRAATKPGAIINEFA